jgi:integrase
MKLTQKAVTALDVPDGKAEAIFFDDDLPGLGLRLRRGGARTWVYQYKIGRQHRRITLGTATALPLAQARDTARDLHAQVRLGRDPAGEKAEGRVRAAETMEAALRTYLTHARARLRTRSYVEVERHLLKHAKPLHGLQLVKIDRRAVASVISAIAAASGAVASNRTRASLAAFFGWAIREGLTDSNPVAGTGRQPEKSRERVLTDEELRAIWAATNRDDGYSAVVRLLMLTGQRASEIAGLRWSEVEKDRIVLPPERTKNGRLHSVPMSEPVRAILESRPRQDGFVFGRREGRPLTGWSVGKRALDERIRALDVSVPPWTLHDLRRTMATRMADLGVAPHVIEACLNHVSGHQGGVAGIYNRASYEGQKRQALALWAKYLVTLAEGREVVVVPLRA